MKEGLRQKKEIIRHGYKYNLVAVNRGEGHHIPQPCFMGNLGYALQSFEKLK